MVLNREHSVLEQVAQDNFFIKFFESKQELYPIRMGLLFNELLKEKKFGYKSFTRLVLEYYDRGFLELEKSMGAGGNTTLVKQFIKR